MENIDTLIKVRWLIPVEPAGLVLAHHALAVRAGRILAIGPAGELSERFEPQCVVDRPEHVLLPGFVNAHTHAAMSLFRGVAETQSFDRWLLEVSALEERWVDAEYVRDGTELAIADMLSSGTTCFGDVYLFPEIAAQSASSAQIRACVGLPVIDRPTAWAESAGECLEKGLRLHDEYRDDPLITTSLCPYTPSDLGDETLIRVRRAADELDLPMTIRVNETPRDAVVGTERTVTRLERLGLLSPLLTAVHMIHVNASEIERCAAAGLSIVHCPQSNLKLGNGTCPAGRFHAHGVNVAIGTDGAASNNDLSMLDEIRTAALLARGLASFQHGQMEGPIDAHQWLQMATLNGARALGLSEEIGSLVEGKWADLCCIDLSRPHCQPVYDPAAAIVFSASRDQVSDVWVAGRAVLSDSRLTRLNAAQLVSRAQRWRDRIAAGLRTS